MLERKKIGLALGSGGARGFAHIGVLKVLEKHNIPIDFISGSSAGAIVGSLYSAQPNAKKLEKEALEATWRDFFDFTISRSGFVKGDKASKFLNSKLAGISFNELKIPLFITALDIENNREIIFNKGDVLKAVRASMSIPGVFQPVENNGCILVDGGIVDPLPVNVLREAGAEIVIAVDVEVVTECPERILGTALKEQSRRQKDLIYIFTKVIQIMGSHIDKVEKERNKPDIMLVPNLKGVGMFDFSKTRQIIRQGENTTKEEIDKIIRITQPNLARDLMGEFHKNISVKKFVSDIRKA